MAFTLPELTYGYDDLAPHMSGETMRLHHGKHHQAYIDKLNAAVESAAELQGKSLEDMLGQVDSLPESVRVAVRNHGGGHYNHSLFWQVLSPQGGGEPSGELITDLNQRYGSIQTFVDQFSTASMALFGSGWTWLMPNLDITTTPNQDNPLMDGGVAPLMGLDIWEHAYYVDYRNRRADYIAAWWNVIDWQFVGTRYSQSRSLL